MLEQMIQGILSTGGTYTQRPGTGFQGLPGSSLPSEATIGQTKSPLLQALMILSPGAFEDLGITGFISDPFKSSSGGGGPVE